jgi:hypothetical protein
VLNASADRRMFVPGQRPAGERCAAGAPSQPSTAYGARLASGLRGVWGRDGQGQRICRLRRIAADVQLIEHWSATTRRLSLNGLSTCKSPLCPLCAPKWARTRSEEITSAIDHWGARRVVFATLTMQHHKPMVLALQHRLLTRAFGHLWSGRKGQAALEEWGGKPESIRAHDRTWSREYGWHPHLHVLFFRQSEAQTAAELEASLYKRWTESLGTALRSMKRFCRKTLANAAQWELLQRANFGGWCVGFRCTCESCTRVRARRMFGRLIRKNEPLLDSIRRVSGLLRSFSETSIKPSRERGVKLETVRAEDRAPTYLSKLGLELSFTEAKNVHERIDQRGRLIRHYPHWGVAHIATRHGHELRVTARRAWEELFTATKGTQTITFSDRDALGLGPDPYAEDQEPPEASPEEFSRLLGQIAGNRWDTMKRQQGHGLLVTIGDAFDLGTLGAMPFVDPPIGFHGLPESRGPPLEPYRQPDGIHWAIITAHAEKRGAQRSSALLALNPLEKLEWVPLVPRDSSGLRWDAGALLAQKIKCAQLGLPFEF